MSSTSVGAARRPWQVVAIGVGTGSLAGLSLLAAGVGAGVPKDLSLLVSLLPAAGVVAWLGSRGPRSEADGAPRAAGPLPGTVPVPSNEPGPAPVVPMAPRRACQRPADPGPGKVLLVDRDPHFVALATSQLARTGHEVRVAASVREGRQVAAGEAGTVEVVVVDLALGEEHGIEAVGEVRRTNPHVRVVLLSGDVREEADVDHLLDAGIEVVRKPVAPEVVVAVVERVRRRERHLAGQLLHA
jgi:CheY-like chemotaxis protein